MNDPVRLSEVANEVWWLIVDAHLDEVCREAGLNPARRWTA